MPAKFDVAIGMDSSTLNTGTAQLYAAPDVREKIFKGVQTGEKDAIPYLVTYDVQAVPTFDLAPGDAITALWPQSIDNSGKVPTGPLPSPNLFVLTLPKFEVEFTLGTTPPVGGTADDVRVFCTLAIANNIVTLDPVSIWIDESTMKLLDKIILNKLLKFVLLKIETMLSALKIPTLSFTKEGITVNLTPPVGAIVNGKLVAAACLQANGTPDISGATWPDKSLFVLITSGTITTVAQEALNQKLVGQEQTQDGDIKVAKWDATGKCTSASIAMNATDLTKFTATVGFEFSAELKPLGIGGPCAMTAATSSI